MFSWELMRCPRPACNGAVRCRLAAWVDCGSSSSASLLLLSSPSCLSASGPTAALPLSASGALHSRSESNIRLALQYQTAVIHTIASLWEQASKEHKESPR